MKDVLPVLETIAAKTMERVKEQATLPPPKTMEDILKEGALAASSGSSSSSSDGTTSAASTPASEDESSSSTSSSSSSTPAANDAAAAAADGKVTTGKLDEDFTRADMQNLHLNVGSKAAPGLVSLDCPGNPCPDFSGSCPVNEFISACSNEVLKDVGFPRPPTPINCPKKDENAGDGDAGMDERCTHKEDFFWYDWQEFQVFKLRNVYVNDEGLMFNKHTHFHREGCNWDSDFVYTKASSPPVHRVKRLVNLVYRQGTGFYHGLIEWMPQFLVLASTLAAHPTVPVLTRTDQWSMYQRVTQPLVGVGLSAIPRLNISDGDLYFAEEVYVPLYQTCGRASPAIWQELRRRFILPKAGIPMFHRDQWKLRGVNPVTPAKAASFPSDWVVVVARRPGTTRVMVEFEELRVLIEAIFTKERVHLFDGSLDILEARSLFRRARLFVAGHGAAMANMVFMPEKANVLEIRPDRDPNACYHHLAHACNLNYYLVFGNGTHDSEVHLGLGKISPVLKNIKAGLA
eukprot:TRINITY_DN27829_c0_g1_i2.p1 TRINITY_DN27829_c0_g1~~TRINITY_DN27829_c0_g1_i2.p1  ORF type:complete len:557 (+),score=31.60 TRINITY_DN27829_c0_g1_i2:121-1671(+)